MTEKNPETMFKCEKCGATFIDSEMLEKHKKSHRESESEDKELEQGTEDPFVKPAIPPGPQIPHDNPPIT